METGISALDAWLESEIPDRGTEGKFAWDSDYVCGLTRVYVGTRCVAVFYGEQRLVRAMRFIALEQ